MKCNTCGTLQPDGWEIENEPGEPGQDGFPPAWDALEFVGKKEPSSTDEALYRCPECGGYYIYSRSIPGGSYDAMKTWIVERLRPVSAEEAGKFALPEPPRETVVSRRCPKCHSADVQRIGGGAIGGEVFITLKCGHCGFEDTLDEYQLDDWYR